MTYNPDVGDFSKEEIQIMKALNISRLGDSGHLEGQGNYILTERGLIRYDDDEWKEGKEEEMRIIDSIKPPSHQ